jgi:hypothetical protein
MKLYNLDHSRCNEGTQAGTISQKECIEKHSPILLL